MKHTPPLQGRGRKQQMRGYHFTARISAHVFSPNYNMAASICHHSIFWLTHDPSCSRWDIPRAAARRKWSATSCRVRAAAPEALQGPICSTMWPTACLQRRFDLTSRKSRDSKRCTWGDINQKRKTWLFNQSYLSTAWTFPAWIIGHFMVKWLNSSELNLNLI